ncbi:unnamed protein product [Cunninghamella blakesleeana]
MSLNNTPVDTYYYDILDVPTNADFLTIKRRFKKLALKYHPDKNKSPNAETKFKEVSEAYEVLVNDSLRSQYDRYGRENIKIEGGFRDAREQFQNMYGGNSFKSVFGSLNLPTVLQQEDQYYKNGEYPPSARNAKEKQLFISKLEQQQEGKVDELVEKLKEKLNAFKQGPSSSSSLLSTSSSSSSSIASSSITKNENENNQKLKNELRLECKQLKSEPYGNSLLLIVGRVYTLQAKRYLGLKGGGWPSLVYSLKDKKYNAKELWKAVQLNLEAQKATDLANEAEKKNNRKEAEEFEDIYVALCYQALFQMVKFEVEATLRCVCQNLLNDKTVKSDELHRRALALQFIGEIYISNSEISELENGIVNLVK